MNKYVIIATLAKPIRIQDKLISLMASCYVLVNLELTKILYPVFNSYSKRWRRFKWYTNLYNSREL